MTGRDFFEGPFVKGIFGLFEYLPYPLNDPPKMTGWGVIKTSRGSHLPGGGLVRVFAPLS